MRKVKVVIEQNIDGLYSAYMKDDTLSFGLNAQGETVKETLKNLDEVYRQTQELYRESGKSIPLLDFEYEYDVASILDYYSKILSKSGLERLTGVNQKQLWHYANGSKRPKKETVLKIQEGLQKLGNELAHLQLID